MEITAGDDRQYQLSVSASVERGKFKRQEHVLCTFLASSIAAAAAADAFMLSSSQHTSWVEVEVYEAVELCEDDNDRASRRIMERNLVGKEGRRKGLPRLGSVFFLAPSDGNVIWINFP